jgi:hypothetical protein
MYTEIQTIEQAMAAHKHQPDFSNVDLSSLPIEIADGMLAFGQLQAIVHTINNDDPKEPEWRADYNDDDQEKWAPWYTGGASDGSGSGFVFYVTYYDWTTTSARGGARLALKDEARAEHMNKYFSDYYKRVLLIIKP